MFNHNFNENDNLMEKMENGFTKNILNENMSQLERDKTLTELSKLEEIVEFNSDGKVILTLDTLKPLTIPVSVSCVDNKAPFYGKQAKIDIILLYNVHEDGGDI